MTMFRALPATLTILMATASAAMLANAQEAPTNAGRLKALIEELKDLPPGPTRKEFVGRRAMSELLVNGSKAYPAIKEAFLTTDHWAVKASTGFLLFGLYNGTDRETDKRLRTLMYDDHPVVRVVACTLLNDVCNGPGKEASEILSRPKEREIKERLNIGMFDVGWLSDEDVGRWVAANLEIVQQVRPLTDPPTFSTVGGGVRIAKGPLTVSEAGLWELKPTSQLAKVGLNNAITSTGRGHANLEALLKCLETDDGSDPGRLGLKIKLMTSVLGHSDRSCKNTQTSDPNRCDKLRGCMDRILPVCKKYLASSTDPWVLNGTIKVIAYLAGSGLKAATELMERESEDHPNDQVRKSLNWWLRGLRERWASEAAERERREAR